MNTSVIGNYTLEYTYTDIAGNTGNTATRVVTVVDTTPAVLTLNGPSTGTIEVFGTYTESGATYTDAIDGTGAAFVVGTVNTSIP